VWIDGPAGSCIWGTGAKRVVMNGNIADGAADVALDLEWCDDSVITGNTVRNFRNAGISLFYSCERIAITGNTVLNDWVPAKEEQAEAVCKIVEHEMIQAGKKIMDLVPVVADAKIADYWSK